MQQSLLLLGTSLVASSLFSAAHVGRDIGTFTAISGVAPAAVAMFAGPMLGYFAVDGDHASGGRPRYAIEGYQGTFTIAAMLSFTSLFLYAFGGVAAGLQPNGQRRGGHTFQMRVLV
jgi:hypothetical protein